MREARLAWSRPRPAADDRRRRRRVMRRAERRLLDQRSIDREHAGDGVDPRHLERLRVPERRQDPRESSREHRLPRPRRAGEEQVVPAAAAISSARRARSWPRTASEVGLSADRPAAARSARAGAVPRSRRGARRPPRRGADADGLDSRKRRLSGGLGGTEHAAIPARRAPSATASVPPTGLMRPSSASSPTAACSASRSAGTCRVAASMASAIERSKPSPPFGAPRARD